MTRLNKIERFKAELYSVDHKVALQASDELVKIGGQDILELFISLLDHENSEIRDIAALSLHDIANNQALEPLLIAIKKSANNNSNGTMAYALETLDCSRKLKEIFDMLFFGDAEVKMAATSILRDQDFYFNSDDLKDINAKWDEIKGHPDQSPLLESYKDTIEYFIDIYTKNNNKPKARN